MQEFLMKHQLPKIEDYLEVDEEEMNENLKE
jgi:hypothetical protein